MIIIAVLVRARTRSRVHLEETILRSEGTRAIGKLTQVGSLRDGTRHTLDASPWDIERLLECRRIEVVNAGREAALLPHL